MGYKSSYSKTEKITLVTNPTYWVEIKLCLSRGEMEAAETLLSQATIGLNGTGSVNPDIVGYRNAMVHQSLVAWNLDDDDTGEIIPITDEAPRILAGPDFDLVWEHVDKLNTSPSDVEAQRFPG